ncbi:hypothetical protein ACQWU4_14650 [Chryseobacterium sp. MIQD13]|uniref:hypothetical protein n=1 Tax=Chryseobacterium sp. MIQD13 TaxID=3422310 RepID=UPI003D2B8CD7
MEIKFNSKVRKLSRKDQSVLVAGQSSFNDEGSSGGSGGGGTNNGTGSGSVTLIRVSRCVFQNQYTMEYITVC